MGPDPPYALEGGPAHRLHSRSPPRYPLESPSEAVPSPLLHGSAQGRWQSPDAHLQVEAGVLHHPLCQRGDVDPPIALPCEEEIIFGVLGEEPEEILQRQVVVASNLEAGGDGGQAARQDPQHPGWARQEAGPSQQPGSLASVSFVTYFLSSEYEKPTPAGDSR